MEHGSVGAVFGNTLFVHGAVDRHSMCFVPEISSTRFELPRERASASAQVTDVRQWVEEMNKFLAAGLADHEARPGKQMHVQSGLRSCCLLDSSRTRVSVH